MEIRELTAGDATALRRSVLGDPRVARWLTAPPHEPFTVEQCERIVTAKVAHRVAHGFGYSLAWDGPICVGWSIAQHCIVDGTGEVEIGWSVASTHWRRGIGTELGRHALGELSGRGLRRVVAYTRADNVASRGVMRRLGMECERSFEHHGMPHVLYSLEL